MDANVQGIIVLHLFLQSVLMWQFGRIVMSYMNSRMPSWSSPPPFAVILPQQQSFQRSPPSPSLQENPSLRQFSGNDTAVLNNSAVDVDDDGEG